MKPITILSGNWSASGNFSGYDARGERIHIPARQMESLGYKVGEPISYPFYSLITERTFNRLDAEGKPTNETFTRIQAGSLFKNEDSLISAMNSDKLLTLKAQKALQTEASSVGLTEDALNALANVAF